MLAIASLIAQFDTVGQWMTVAAAVAVGTASSSPRPAAAGPRSILERSGLIEVAAARLGLD